VLPFFARKQIGNIHQKKLPLFKPTVIELALVSFLSYPSPKASLRRLIATLVFLQTFLCPKWLRAHYKECRKLQKHAAESLRMKAEEVGAFSGWKGLQFRERGFKCEQCKNFFPSEYLLFEHKGFFGSHENQEDKEIKTEDGFPDVFELVSQVDLSPPNTFPPNGEVKTLSELLQDGDDFF